MYRCAQCVTTHTEKNDHTSSREHAWLKIAHLCVSKQLSSTCHVSFFAAPDTDQKNKFSLTYLTYLSDVLSLTPKSFGARSTVTLRRSTAEWRINTNPISHKHNARIVVESLATIRVVSGRWVNTLKRRRFTVRYFERWHTDEDHHAPVPLHSLVKVVLTWAASEFGAGANGDCGDAFLQTELDEEARVHSFSAWKLMVAPFWADHELKQCSRIWCTANTLIVAAIQLSFACLNSWFSTAEQNLSRMRMVASVLLVGLQLFSSETWS